MTDLLELADRVEALEGPSQEVAKAIFRAVHPDKVPSPIVTSGYGWREDDSGWWLATGEDSRTPPKTIYPPNWLTSLDAALSLVPEGCGWFAGWGQTRPDEPMGGARITRNARFIGYDANYDPIAEAEASTPALALVAASLRAIAARTAGEVGR